MSTRNSAARSMMGIASPTASHLPVLEKAARAAGDGLVIEHGAGLYSTPLLARLGCRVLCAEPHLAWAEWATWVYEGRAEMVASVDTDRLADAAVVFLDGPAKERGPLLQACLDARVPVVIAHDTNKREWSSHGFVAEMFEREAYEVTHTAEDSHRTTLWRLR